MLKLASVFLSLCLVLSFGVASAEYRPAQAIQVKGYCKSEVAIRNILKGDKVLQGNCWLTFYPFACMVIQVHGTVKAKSGKSYHVYSCKPLNQTIPHKIVWTFSDV